MILLRHAQDERSWRDIAGRLARRARRLAEAQALARLLARRGDASRWRRAALLWPLFSKER